MLQQHKETGRVIYRGRVLLHYDFNIIFREINGKVISLIGVVCTKLLGDTSRFYFAISLRDSVGALLCCQKINMWKPQQSYPVEINMREYVEYSLMWYNNFSISIYLSKYIWFILVIYSIRHSPKIWRYTRTYSINEFWCYDFVEIFPTGTYIQYVYFYTIIHTGHTCSATHFFAAFCW